MAESVVALCFSSSSSTFPSFPSLSRLSPAKNLSFAKSTSPRFQSFRFIRCGAKDSDDSFGLWDSSLPDADGGIQWVPEERVTLFTTDGLVQIGGSLVPKRISSSNKKQGGSKAFRRIERFQESDYMDPNQGLCLGALFNIAATNGLDMGRRLCIFGFCRSIEMLSDVVEDTVLEHGGELCTSGPSGLSTIDSPRVSGAVIGLGRKHQSVLVNKQCMIVVAEKASKGDLQEKLTMTVAVPLLWGVPPASETLRLAVRSGGGIVDKVYWQWDFL